MQRTAGIVGRKTDKSLPSQSSHPAEDQQIKQAIIIKHDVFGKSIPVRTEINDSSSVITETCRIRKKYSEESGKKLFKRKSRKEKDDRMFEAMTECQRAEV